MAVQRRAQRVEGEGEATVDEVSVNVEFSGDEKDIKKNSKVYRGAKIQGVYIPNDILEKLGNPNELELVFRPRS